jgi:hypothetical protein
MSKDFVEKRRSDLIAAVDPDGNAHLDESSAHGFQSAGAVQNQVARRREGTPLRGR